jgi:branched-chain amino acid transport system permease protein
MTQHSSAALRRWKVEGASTAVRGLGAVRLAGYLVILALALGVPFVLNSGYDLNVLVDMATNVSLATGLAIVVRAGRMSLAQATFAGLGGYVSGILVMQQDWNYWLALLAAGVLSAVFGALLGLTSLRLQGFYFAIATFAFSQIVMIVLSAWTSVTGGLNGMFGLPFPPPIGTFDFTDPMTYYYLTLIGAIASVLVYYLCSAGTRFGRSISVLGEDEVLAGALGVPATAYRLIAFAISSCVGGVAGSLHTHFIQGISPPDLALSISVSLLVMVMAGGARSLMGPAVGAVLLTAVPELLRASYQWSLVFYGAFLLTYIYLFPGGLLPLADRWLRAALHRSSPAGNEESPATPDPEAARSSLPVQAIHYPTESDILILDRVRCAFDATVVLDQLDLRVRAGELRGIIGPNGAGKTTLFNVITGAAPLVSGTVALGGRTVHPRPSLMARHGVSRTFQHPRILESHTVADGISLAAELSGREVDRSHVEWTVDATRVRSLLRLRGSQLTHLQRRLVTLAMAIVSRPSLVLLDEPLAGLDDTETNLVKGLIRDIHRQLGCTILLIEHKLGVVMELCGVVTVLDYGRVIAEGDPAAVAKDPKVVMAYLGT